ncbi:MAG: hypothetical protein HQK63_00100 [Desulfamplus sp.]|nr:hypothetical protein [Desulfamplus sp.]
MIDFKKTTPAKLLLLETAMTRKKNQTAGQAIEQDDQKIGGGRVLIEDSGDNYKSLAVYYDKNDPIYALATKQQNTAEHLTMLENNVLSVMSKITLARPEFFAPQLHNINYKNHVNNLLLNTMIFEFWHNTIINKTKRFFKFTLAEARHIQIITESRIQHISYLRPKQQDALHIAGGQRAVLAEPRSLNYTCKTPELMLVKPDQPQALPPETQLINSWQKADALYHVPEKLKRIFKLTLAEAKHIQVITESRIKHLAVLKDNNQKIIAGSRRPWRLCRSVIIDIADNYGNANYLGIRSIDFYNAAGQLINLTAADVDAYASLTYSSFLPNKTFISALSKINAWTNNQWLGSASKITKQRLICVFKQPQLAEIHKIIINNGHSSGGTTNSGAKNIKLYFSNDIITDTVFESSLDVVDQVWSGVLPQHKSSNVIDDFVINVFEK